MDDSRLRVCGVTVHKSAMTGDDVRLRAGVMVHISVVVADDSRGCARACMCVRFEHQESDSGMMAWISA